MRRSILLLALALLWPFAAAADGNFSQYPGFREWFERHPPASAPPGPEARALLARHRPRFFLPAGHEGLIDFYRDYIAQGRLLDGAGRVISEAVTADLLAAHKSDPAAVFEHVPRPGPTHPTVYGRIDRDSLDSEAGPVPLVFLTYHAVFRVSGLPAGLPAWQEGPLSLFLDLDDWHQLDHCTAATVVLDEAERPIALLLQQHNDQRSYLFGADLAWPEDGRVALDVAIRSNELYPHEPGRRRHRMVRFVDPAGLRFLMGFGPAPWAAGFDVTEPAREQDYRLDFLAPDDAFYVFQGYLGARRLLPGRSGPPGAAYNTLPAMKSWALQLLGGYWREGHAGDLARLEAAERCPLWRLCFAEAQAPVFLRNRICVREGCPVE